MAKKCYTQKQIEAVVKGKGYKWFENGDYNLNIVGIRNSETRGKVTNKFDEETDGNRYPYQFIAVCLLEFIKLLKRETAYFRAQKRLMLL